MAPMTTKPQKTGFCFEFCKTYLELSNYIRPLYQYGNNARIWFSGKIDTVNGIVILANCGRINKGSN
ncbi:MAG: hypothetical protein M3162_08545 [Thermoproteota archaeon]|nr:hypothetical protein [Thermoproteota archaeon]